MVVARGQAPADGCVSGLLFRGFIMSNPPSSAGKHLTVLGVLFSLLLVFGLIGLGAWIVLREVINKPAVPVVKATTMSGTGDGAGAGAGGGGGGAAVPILLGFDASKLADTKDKGP